MFSCDFTRSVNHPKKFIFANILGLIFIPLVCTYPHTTYKEMMLMAEGRKGCDPGSQQLLPV